MIPLLVPKIPPWEFFVTDEEDGAGMLDDGSFLHWTWLNLAVPGYTLLFQGLIYITTDCHILPLTGLNASVLTGLNKWMGWMGWKSLLAPLLRGQSTKEHLKIPPKKSKKTFLVWARSKATFASSLAPNIFAGSRNKIFLGTRLYSENLLWAPFFEW